MLKIWGRVNSSNVQKVLWLADELGLRYERVEAGGAFGRTADADYRAMNPTGLVPTLQDDDFVLWESNSICRYLATRENAVTLLPATDTVASVRARAEVEKWMDWSSTAVAPAMHGAFWGLVRTPPEKQDREAILLSADRTAAQMSIIDEALSARPWLAGDHFTLADVPAGIFAWRWFRLPWAQVGYQPRPLPRLEAWHRRLAERQAYQRWVMQPVT
jgi:glutathione S-transferase